MIYPYLTPPKGVEAYLPLQEDNKYQFKRAEQPFGIKIRTNDASAAIIHYNTHQTWVFSL